MKIKTLLALLLCINLLGCASPAKPVEVENPVRDAIVTLMEENKTNADWFLGITIPAEKSIIETEYKITLIMDEFNVADQYKKNVTTMKEVLTDLVKNAKLEKVEVEESPKNFFTYYRIPYTASDWYIMAIYDNGLVSFEKDTTLKKDYTYYSLEEVYIQKIVDTVNECYKPMLEDMKEHPENYQGSDEEDEGLTF